jgi:hypothetical protein
MNPATAPLRVTLQRHCPRNWLRFEIARRGNTRQSSTREKITFGTSARTESAAICVLERCVRQEFQDVASRRRARRGIQ